MRKLLLILASSLTITLFSNSTYGQMLQIACMNGPEICQGFMPENQAQVQIMGGLPMSVPDNTYVTYVWTSTHANGKKTWDTSRPDRKIPIPWLGEYTVQVQVLFTRHGKTRPYAVFWSNQITLAGKVCKP